MSYQHFTMQEQTLGQHLSYYNHSNQEVKLLLNTADTFINAVISCRSLHLFICDAKNYKLHEVVFMTLTVGKRYLMAYF